MVLYTDSEDTCGDSDTICEVSRVSTEIDMMCGMLKEMGRVDHEKLKKEVQADGKSAAGKVNLVANRALSETEIQADFNEIKNSKSAQAANQ